MEAIHTMKPASRTPQNRASIVAAAALMCVSVRRGLDTDNPTRLNTNKAPGTVLRSNRAPRVSLVSSPPMAHGARAHTIPMGRERPVRAVGNARAIGLAPGTMSIPIDPNAAPIMAARAKNCAGQSRRCVRLLIVSRERLSKMNMAAPMGDMRRRKPTVASVGAVTNSSLSIPKSRWKRNSARLSAPITPVLIAAALAVTDEEGGIAGVRNSHREIPASTEAAAELGAMGVAAPQVIRLLRCSAHPANTASPAPPPKRPAAAATPAQRRTRRASAPLLHDSRHSRISLVAEPASVSLRAREKGHGSDQNSSHPIGMEQDVL